MNLPDKILAEIDGRECFFFKAEPTNIQYGKYMVSKDMPINHFESIKTAVEFLNASFKEILSKTPEGLKNIECTAVLNPDGKIMLSLRGHSVSQFNDGYYFGGCINK